MSHSIHSLARRVVEAKAKGDENPLPIRAFFTGAGLDQAYDKDDVESLVARLCEEIVAMETDAKAQSERTGAAFAYLRTWTGDTQHLSNAEEIDAGNMDAEGNWITRGSR